MTFSGFSNIYYFIIGYYRIRSVGIEFANGQDLLENPYMGEEPSSHCQTPLPSEGSLLMACSLLFEKPLLRMRG
jgi:hypothetical protein